MFTFSILVQLIRQIVTVQNVGVSPTSTFHMFSRNILCDAGVSPASTLSQSEAALRQHQHGAFAKKYRQRQRLRAEKDTAEQKMRDAIEEHFAEEKKCVFNLRREGEGELCVLCESKIYGALHCNQMEELMHWGCAYAMRKPVWCLH